mmetsp:Transcript_48905/g.79372  ORF Transcript_48905/g.79372 Transcript_48905/m.79372 type:complete len:317 (-) Transcript_48905:303-1253(-)
MSDDEGDDPLKHDVFIDDDGVMWGQDELGKYKIDDKVWTMNEIRDHPLFMVDMPQDISENPHLMALQAMMYDDQTPEEMAQHMKNQGNEAMKLGASKICLQNALTFYTRGIDMECKDDKLNSVLHSNRAAVSLKMGLHIKVTEDCRKAARLDASNLKAWYRGARGSEALGLAHQGLKFCDGALRIDPKEPDVLRVQKNLESMRESQELAQEEVRNNHREEVKSFKAQGAAVSELLALRGSRLGPLLFDMSMYAMAFGENRQLQCRYRTMVKRDQFPSTGRFFCFTMRATSPTSWRPSTNEPRWRSSCSSCFRRIGQ